jgi:hypothetical protein
MQGPALSLAGRRILVVEDEYLLAVQVKCWLLAAGSVVIGPVPNVDQAMNLIEDDCPTAAVACRPDQDQHGHHQG